MVFTSVIIAPIAQLLAASGSRLTTPNYVLMQSYTTEHD
jgi:hypothetical protein